MRVGDYRIIYAIFVKGRTGGSHMQDGKAGGSHLSRSPRDHPACQERTQRQVERQFIGPSYNSRMPSSGCLGDRLSWQAIWAGRLGCISAFGFENGSMPEPPRAAGDGWRGPDRAANRDQDYLRIGLYPHVGIGASPRPAPRKYTSRPVICHAACQTLRRRCVEF